MEKLEHTPMSDKVKERIERDADEWVVTNNRDLFGFGHELAYIAGATAERPKARNEAIDECIEVAYMHDFIDNWSELKLKLEKLKHKQP